MKEGQGWHVRQGEQSFQAQSQKSVLYDKANHLLYPHKNGTAQGDEREVM